MFARLVAILAGHLIEMARLKAYAVAFYLVAAALLAFALGFALVGLRNWLAVAYLLEYPDLWIALGLLVVAAILGGVGLYVGRQRPKTHPATDIALIAGPTAVSFAARRVDARVIALGAALMAGVVVGRRLKRSSS